MEKPIIEVKNLGKKYNIVHMRGGYVALRDVLTNIFRNPFSFLKHKTKQAIGLEKKEEFWALKDISFTVKKGEVVGIIGANGAGKSTLLKILSQITPPTEGEVILRGRVGSLLEVGTGFHPELTGRENIFLNGAILGMKKAEIEKKFDQIVEFAGIEKFLDTPVKRYSSGMYVRLAFAVAAHMEPDILLVDEVLAVGDAEFQKKCLGKMDEITRTEGRTILFVSHNMESVRQLCQRSILLERGAVIQVGETDKIIGSYLQRTGKLGTNNLRYNLKNRRGDGKAKIVGLELEDRSGKKINSVKTWDPLILRFYYECQNPEEIKELDMGFSLHREGRLLSMLYSSQSNSTCKKVSKRGNMTFEIESIPFGAGNYEIGVRLLADGIEADWPKDPAAFFEVHGSDPKSPVILKGHWK